MPNMIKGQSIETKKRFFEVYYELNNNNIIGFKRDNSGWNKWMEEQKNEIGGNDKEETKTKSFFKHKNTKANNDISNELLLQQSKNNIPIIMKKRNEIMFPWRIEPIITKEEEEKQAEKEEKIENENDENVEYETFWSEVHRYIYIYMK